MSSYHEATPPRDTATTREGSSRNAVLTHRRNGIQYSASNPTSDSHGPTTTVCALLTMSSISRSTLHAARDHWSCSRRSARCRSASRTGRLSLRNKLMMRRAETEAQQVHRTEVELDEAPLSQAREDALGHLEVVEPEAGDVRVERERVRASQRRDVREAPIGADVGLRARDDARLHVEVRGRRHQVIDRVNPPSCPLRDVLVIVEPLSGVEEHDIDVPRELFEIRRDERVILRGVGERGIAVELRCHVSPG